MFIKSLLLDNIRSYTNENIKFPKGSLLLSGDIGSGKSTILLAIEFALFGLKQGELTGSTLLRYGAMNGSVQLTFSIKGQEYTIKRTLKKSKDRISQGPGFFIEKDIQTELMPKELKAKIYDILNYPKSLVSKNQDLIYRFTVFTPQEEMKKIIYEDKDSRLDTLRKVFNIDKYKRIRENATIYLRNLKTIKANLQGKTADYEQKKLQLEKIKTNIDKLKSERKTAQKDFNEAKLKTTNKKNEISKAEDKIKVLNEKKSTLAKLNTELKSELSRREDDKSEIEILQKQILTLKDELTDYQSDLDLAPMLDDKKRRLDTLEKELSNLIKSKSEITGKSTFLKQEADKINNIDSCPLCLQNVSHTHKKDIVASRSKTIEELTEKFNELALQETSAKSNLDSLKNEITKLQEKKSKTDLLELKRKNMLEKQDTLAKLRNREETYRKKVGEINSAKIDLTKEIFEYESIENSYVLIKEEYELLLKKERQKELDNNSLSKEIESFNAQYLQFTAEIAQKEAEMKKLKQTQILINWLDQTFIPLVQNMEKHVMMTVYHEFNELLQKWFGILIEDENFSIRLDDSFCVIVEQNGFESTIDNLSGGEKTSVALSYRLALNKVINDVVSQINTRDIIILDEPTEGFSTDQLDRVRDVLEQINISQVILVSHESKIESFVDNVIRVEKQNSISNIGVTSL